MSSSGRALAQSIAGFGQAFQNMGETIYKVDAHNEATTLQIKIASEIENFHQSLLMDPNPGTPGDLNSDGYMKKWQDLKQKLYETADGAKNPLARQEVREYLGQTLPNQEGRVAQIQFNNWGERQKVERYKNILSIAKVNDPQAVLDMARASFGELLGTVLTSQEYERMMADVAEYVIQEDVYKKAAQAFDKDGEAAAYKAIAEQSIYTSGTDTFQVTEQTRAKVRERLGYYINSVYYEEEKKLSEKMTNTYKKANGQLKPGDDGEYPEILTFDDIENARVRQETKDSYKVRLDALTRDIVAKTYADEEIPLFEGYLLGLKKAKGETLTAEEEAKVLTRDKLKELVTSNKLRPERAAFYENLCDEIDKKGKETSSNKAKTEVGQAIAALRRAAFSKTGAFENNNDMALAAKINDAWIDGFTELTADERNQFKEEVAQLNAMKKSRTEQSTYTENDNKVYEKLAVLAEKAAAGEGYSETELEKLKKEITTLISSANPANKGAMDVEAARLYGEIARNNKTTSQADKFYSFAKRAAEYKLKGTGLTTKEIDEAVKGKEITEAQGQWLLEEMNQRDLLKQAEADAQAKAAAKDAAALDRYKKIHTAYEALQKQNKGEELAEGETALSHEYLTKVEGITDNEMQFWDAMLEKESAQQQKASEIKDAGTRERRLSKAMANSYEYLRTGEKKEGVEYLTPDFVSTVFSGVDDPSVKEWTAIAEQLENTGTQKAKDKSISDWVLEGYEREENSEKKARGENYDKEKLLDEDFLKKAPAGVDESTVGYFRRKVVSIGDAETQYEKEQAVKVFEEKLGNTIRLANGEPIGNGASILTFEEIWNNNNLTLDTKLTISNLLTSLINKATGETGTKSASSTISKEDKANALDILESGARIAARVKGGDTKNAVWRFYFNGKQYSIDLGKAKDPAEIWEQIASDKQLIQYIEGNTSKIEEFREMIKKGAQNNTYTNYIEDFIAAKKKDNNAKNSVYLSNNAEAFRAWANAIARENPGITKEVLWQKLEEGFKAKALTYNIKTSFDLALNMVTTPEKWVDDLTLGKFKNFMGKTEDGVWVPMHPAAKDEMLGFALKFGEAMRIIPGGDKINIDPKSGNAVGYWGPDGQYYITLSKEALNKLKGNNKNVFNYELPKDAQSVQFFLGIVNETKGYDAHIIMRVIKGQSHYDMALYNNEWKSIFPLDFTKYPYRFTTKEALENSQKQPTGAPTTTATGKSDIEEKWKTKDIGK